MTPEQEAIYDIEVKAAQKLLHSRCDDVPSHSLEHIIAQTKTLNKMIEPMQQEEQELRTKMRRFKMPKTTDEVLKFMNFSDQLQRLDSLVRVKAQVEVEFRSANISKGQYQLDKICGDFSKRVEAILVYATELDDQFEGGIGMRLDIGRPLAENTSQNAPEPLLPILFAPPVTKSMLPFYQDLNLLGQAEPRKTLQTDRTGRNENGEPDEFMHEALKELVDIWRDISELQKRLARLRFQVTAGIPAYLRFREYIDKEFYTEGGRFTKDTKDCVKTLKKLRDIVVKVKKAQGEATDAFQALVDARGK